MGFTLVNDVTATVATQSNSGTTSLVVGTGLGAQFASATTANPIRCGAFDSTGALKFYFDVTGRSTDTLTVANRGAESTTDANILTTDLIAAVPTASVINTLPLGLGVYGDGSDGTVTFDGTTTILGMAPASSIYTLTRDLWLAAATINSGVVLSTNGFRIFCAGTLTNNGTIRSNGSSAGTAATGAAAATSTTQTTLAWDGSALDTAGGNGNTGSGSVGAALAGHYSFGGAGGAGGSGSTGGGGAGGTVVAPTAAASAPRMGTFVGRLSTAQELNGWSAFGGSGGGGGGGDGTNTAGGGGGGGGVVVISARTFAGTGNIQARGGAGGSRTTGNVGGGGGGGGGLVTVVSGSVSGGAISGQTIDANGGAAGAKVGTGNNGNAGNNGTVILIPN